MPMCRDATASRLLATFQTATASAIGSGPTSARRAIHIANRRRAPPSESPATLEQKTASRIPFVDCRTYRATDLQSRRCDPWCSHPVDLKSLQPGQLVFVLPIAAGREAPPTV